MLLVVEARPIAGVGVRDTAHAGEKAEKGQRREGAQG
jgi:hypothetical protein